MSGAAARANRSPSLVDVLTASAPAGRFESPLDDRHILDVHLGHPVQVACRLEGCERPALQTHGSFCIVPAGASGRWTMARPLDALLIRIAPPLLTDIAESTGVRAWRGPLAPARHQRDPQVERLAWLLQSERDDGFPGGRLFTDSLAIALVTRLLGLQSHTTPAAPRVQRGLPRQRLRTVFDYIETHLADALSLAELAAIAGFSVSHFKALFTQAVGMPVHRYVLERRVERARVLVLAGKQRMTDIALETGFSHPSHMARSMRRVLGQTPAQLARSR